MHRCPWAAEEPLRSYHDREWGVPVAGDRALFAALCLEGAQAGLSWRTVLLRRQGYHRAFAAFDAARIARFTDAHLARLAQDPGIIRHAGKIRAVRTNARALLRLQAEAGSFARWLTGCCGARARAPAGPRAGSALGRRLSRALRERGFTFVGPTICQAFLQAVGQVNGHTATCARGQALARRR